MKKVSVFFFAVVFLLCMTAAPVLAADTSKEVEQLKGDVQKLLNRIQELEKKQKESDKKFESVKEAATKIEKEEAQLKEEKKQKALAYWKDGFFIETPDKQFKLQMGGQVHFDTRIFSEDNPNPSSFDIRRARYDMRGSMYTGDIEHLFRLQVELADSPLVQNAYWMFKFRPEFNLMIGQFKPPVNSSDRMTEEGHMNFIEFGVDVPLTAYYDRGFNIISKFLNNRVQTCVGMINGVGSDADVNQGDLDNNKNYFVRLLLNPFKDTDISALKQLYFVGSYEDGLQSIKTARGETNMRTPDYESQWFQWTQSNVRIHDRQRYGAEVHYITGPLAASYEYNRIQWNDIKVYKSDGKTLSFSLPGSHHYDVQQAWVSYFLTGEQKTYEDVFFAWRQPKPKKNFSLKEGTWGAWEVIARYTKNEGSPDLFAKQISTDSTSVILSGVQEGYSLTGGLRWLWNPKVRVMLDMNYLKSEQGKGIFAQSSYITLNDKKRNIKDETTFLMRFILQI
jgi:phosphate-selective porin OprO and OprP